MAKQTYQHGSLIQLFYHNGTKWVTFSYVQNNSLSLSNETTSISSKDHGNWAQQEVTGSSWSLSGESYFCKDDVDVILQMQAKATPFTFAFAKVSSDDYASGLKDVTSVGDTSEWEIGSDFVRYGTGLVTSCSITANNGEIATVSIEVTGSGGLSSTEPTTIKSYTTE